MVVSQFTPLTFAMLSFVEAHGHLDIAAKRSGRIPEPMRVSAFSLSQRHHRSREAVSVGARSDSYAHRGLTRHLG